MLPKEDSSLENSFFTKPTNAGKPSIPFVIFDSKNGVYTLFIETKSELRKDYAKYKYLKFWAIPKSFKVITENNSEGKYEFKARLYSTEPRKGKGFSTPEIELNCELNYKI